MGKYLSLTGLFHFLDQVRNEINRKMFEYKYAIFSAQTIITKNTDGSVEGIVEENDYGIATTVFSESDNVKTITTQLAPTTGKWNYIKSTTITYDESSTIITESYSKTEK